MPTDRTPSEIAERIRGNTNLDLASIRDYLTAAVGPSGTPVSGLGPTLVAPSVELDDVTVTVTVWSSDPSYLGTVDRSAGTRMVQVAVNARSNTASTTYNGIQRWPPVDVPVREQIAWVRVALEAWADHAYRIVTDRGLFRVQPAFFMVLIDRDGSPRLAPSDFKWILVSSGGRRAYPEKLVPEDRELLAYLRKHGDLVAADLVPHPQAPPPQVWAHEFVSHLTSTVADQLGRMSNGRWFTFDEVSLHGTNQVIVRYTWHLLDGDKAYGFDIDLAGVRERRLRRFDDPRARTAATSIGSLPFAQPVFQAPEVIDGVTWIRFGAPE